MTAGPVLARWSAAAGVVLVLVGIVTFATGGPHDIGGWFVYAPLTDTPPQFPPGLWLRPQHLWGLALLTLGALLLAGLAGYVLGRVGNSRSGPPPR